MENDWKAKLRDKMSGYSEPEPEGLWEDILSHADIQPKTEVHGRRGQVLRVIPRILVPAAAAAAIAFFAVLKENTKVTSPAPDTTAVSGIVPPDGNRIDVIQPEAEEIPQLLAESRQKPGSTSGQDAPVMANNIPASEQSSHKTETEQVSSETAKVQGTPSSGREEGQSGAEDTSAAQSTSGKRTDRGPDGQRTDSGTGSRQSWDFPEDNMRKKPARRRISSSVFISNLSGSTRNLEGFGTPQTTATAFKGIPASYEISGTPGNGVMMLTKEKESSTDIRHRQPIRTGISFRYNLTERWGVETGLTYSYLSSMMTTGNGTYSGTTDQTLHYIGIPVKASYNFFTRRFITLYASAGGMAEKCVGGKAVTEYKLNNDPIRTSEESLTVKQLQWSVNAAVGAQFNFTRFFGLYIEPGASWHFDDGSMVSTIYKEKPLNFNIEFGLRFSFE